MQTIFEGSLDVHYGFAWLFTDIDGHGLGVDLVVTRSGQANGLCGAAVPGLLSFVTGLHTGQVPFTIQWHPSAPDVEPGWEEVVEVSLDVAGTTGSLAAFEDSHELVLPATGPHRARYCAFGMDAAHNQDVSLDEVPAPDRYLLALWPAPTAEDAVLRQTGDVAAYWHETAREQPALTRQELDAALVDTHAEQVEIEWVMDEDEDWESIHFDDEDQSIRAHLATLQQADQRRAACWFVGQAFSIAELDHLEWVRPALAALAAGQPLPAPFTDLRRAARYLRSVREAAEAVGSPIGAVVRSERHDGLYDRPSFALPSLFAALESDPLVAARDSYEHAAETFHEEKDLLVDKFWTVFGSNGSSTNG